MINIGYCCLNLTLRDQKPSIYTGRTLNKKNYDLNKSLELALDNIKDLFKILQWNEENNIKVFRITSELFPRYTEQRYIIEESLLYSEIKYWLRKCGEFAFKNKHILSMHPGPYNVLCSDNPKVVEDTICGLNHHSWILDHIENFGEFPLKTKINIHMGKSFAPELAKKWIQGYDRLDYMTQNRLILENDDKANGWSIYKLHEYLYNAIAIPLTLDLHHSHFSRESNVSLEDEFALAYSTWHHEDYAEIHYSESASEDKIIPAHSDYYRNPLPEWLEGKDVYVHLECKLKDLALLKYRKDFLT